MNEKSFFDAHAFLQYASGENRLLVLIFNIYVSLLLVVFYAYSVNVLLGAVVLILSIAALAKIEIDQLWFNLTAWRR